MVNAGNLFDRLIIGAILASVGVVVLETEPTLVAYTSWFQYANYFFATLFTIEYGYRIKQAGTWRYIYSPLAIIDLLALIPFFLVFFSDAFLLRLFRLARLLSLAKLGRFSRAHSCILKAIWGVRYELGVAMAMSFLAIVLAASCMYIIEGPVQAEAFGSIPRAMWWGVVSLTTIGYGDVYPSTLGGKLFTAFYALIAIGFVGVVSGIIVSAVTGALSGDRADLDGEYPTEADYRKFEVGFIQGKEYALDWGDNPWTGRPDNPFEKPEDDPHKRICEHEGWHEGVRSVMENQYENGSVNT